MKRDIVDGPSWRDLFLATVAALCLSGCAILGSFVPHPTPRPTPTVATPEPATPSPLPTCPSGTTQFCDMGRCGCLAPTATPTVKPPVLKEWKNGLHGGKLNVIDGVHFDGGGVGKAILYDSTRHYDHPWPDVCDGHEPAWSTWCGQISWDALKPATWDAKVAASGQAVKMANVGGQPYAKYVQYLPGRKVVVRTCPHLPDVVAGGIALKVLGDGCGESTFVPPAGL